MTNMVVNELNNCMNCWKRQVGNNYYNSGIYSPIGKRTLRDKRMDPYLEPVKSEETELDDLRKTRMSQCLQQRGADAGIHLSQQHDDAMLIDEQPCTSSCWLNTHMAGQPLYSNNGWSGDVYNDQYSDVNVTDRNALLDDIDSLIKEESIFETEQRLTVSPHLLSIQHPTESPQLPTTTVTLQLSAKRHPVTANNRELLVHPTELLGTPDTTSNHEESALLSDDEMDTDDSESSFSSTHSGERRQLDEEYLPTTLDSPLSSTSSDHGASFWKYNSQQKGPKGTKFDLKVASPVDPHKLASFTDPVFDESQHVNVKHLGKARKGDGNDTTPDPQKLHSIGLALNDLTSEIANLKGDSMSVRKQKNVLSSRMCRLKKKANNEANKIKYYGLTKEHEELKSTIELLNNLISEESRKRTSRCMVEAHKAIVKETLKTHARGRTTPYVDEILLRVENGENVVLDR